MSNHFGTLFIKGLKLLYESASLNLIGYANKILIAFLCDQINSSQVVKLR